MKKIFSTALSFLLLLGAISACEQSETVKEKPQLGFSRDLITFLHTGGADTVKVISNQDWVIVEDETTPWISCDRYSGKAGETVLSVSVDAENTSYQARMGGVRFRTEGLTSQISIAQMPAPNTNVILVNPTRLELEYGAETYPVTVTSTVDWAAEAAQTYDWISFTPSSGKTGESSMSFTVTENKGKTSRTARILFNGGEAPQTEFIVFQEAFEYIDVTTSSVSFDEAGVAEVNTVHVKGNVDWTAVSTAPEWLTIDRNSGSKGEDVAITLSAGANTGSARSASVVITGGTEAEAIISVSQKGKNVSVTTLLSFNVNDATYTDSHSPDWSVSGANAYSHGSGKGIALPEETESKGYMAFVGGGQLSLSYTYITAKEGHFAVKPIWTGDAFCFHVPVTGAAKDAIVRFQTGYRGVNWCPKYWTVQFSTDGGVSWAYADTGMESTAPNGEKYTTCLTTINVVETVNAVCVLPSAIASGEIIIRFMCADGSGTISKGTVDSPNADATVRLTPFTDKDGSSRKGPVITYEF